MNYNNYCNNCGKYGHLFHQCKFPITSFGVICFRKNPDLDKIEYLMIKRKDTLGLIDFIRGKYSIYNKEYILNMIKQMTNCEKEKLLTMDFGELWQHVWGNLNTLGEQYRNEEIMSREKFNLLKSGVFSRTEFYNLNDLVEESNKFQMWEDAEWGFPKGRRNSLEKDFDCALREFCEETGYLKSQLILLKNIMPFEEIFTGSNYKSYKHKYYIMHMNYSDSLQMKRFQATEVGDCCWKSFDDCMTSIRCYNLEKKRMLVNINNMLIMFQSGGDSVSSSLNFYFDK